MALDATFWVAVSFIIFFGGLVYLKVPQKINEMLNNMILGIKNEIDESEKLRTEAKTLLENAQTYQFINYLEDTMMLSLVMSLVHIIEMVKIMRN